MRVGRAGVIATVGTMVAAATLAVTGPASGQSGPGCAAPYPPVASQRLGFDGTLAEPGPRVAVDQLGSTPELNDDGTARVDTGQPFGPTLVVIRPSGDLELSRGGAPLAGSSAGDLDGDGEDEVWVFELSPDLRTLMAGYVVWSGTAPGAHDVATVGTRAPAGVSVGATTWDGDAVPDLFVVTDTDPSMRSGTTVVLSGADLAAAGPGGDASSGAEIRTVEGVAGAVARFASGNELVTSSVEGDGEGERVRSDDGTRSIEFTTVPDEYQPDNMGVGAVLAFERDGVRYLTIANSNRGGAISWTWSLDEPCVQIGPRATRSTSGAPAPVPSPSQPSATVAADAPIRFTG